MRVRIAAAALAGALLLASAVAGAEEDASLEQLFVERANTPADHTALARYYHTRAEQARADARRHEAMGRTYGRGKQRSGSPSLHCDRLSERFARMASEYESLAKLHEEAAK